MSTETGLLPVVHHTCLQMRGGALQAAKTLHEDLLRRSLPSSMTYEIRETDARQGSEQDDEVDPNSKQMDAGKVGENLPKGAILHLHSTRDWLGLLGSLKQETPLIITAHDCSPVMGGCSHPLSCRRFEQGCPPPCPLGFEHTDQVFHARREHMLRLKPLITAPSSWLMKIIRTVLPEVRTKVIPNGVPQPCRLMPKNEARSILGVAPEARLLLFVAHGGIRAAYKSGPMWLEYWKAVKKAVPEAVCFMAGGDEAGRDGDLFFWPYVPEDKLSPLMRAADVLAYPTLADNHPLTVLEAMAAALPVVSFAEGGVPEQVQDSRTGLLVPPGDHQGFTDALIRILKNPSLGRQMGTEAREYSRTRFTPKRMADAFVSAYMRLTRPDD